MIERRRRPLGLVDDIGDPLRSRVRRPRRAHRLARPPPRLVERIAWPLVTLAAEVALLFWVGFVALGYGPG